jgi:hypothetical protein
VAQFSFWTGSIGIVCPRGQTSDNVGHLLDPVSIKVWQARDGAVAGVGNRGPRSVDDGCVLGDRWGVNPSDIMRSYPCDDFVVSPTLQAWRGVNVAAPREAVWPWVAQVRLAPYSYDWIDNLGHHSPRELVGLPEPHVGEHFTSTGGRKVGRIVSLNQGEQLTGTILGAFMSYVLLDQGHDSTRLLLKVVMQTHRWAAPGLSVGDLIMARRQLLNIKHLAERRHDHDVPEG